MAIIGGGPAGAAAACQLARRRRRVVLVERRRFPRFHIGESLLPASNPIFAALGLRERLRDEAFVEKRGASFTTQDEEMESYIDFTACPRVPAPVTWQVPRARFDEILLDHARSQGVEVRQEGRVKDVAFEADGVTLTTTDSDGGETAVRAEVVVDASGQAGFLAKRLDLRRTDPELRKVAFYAHFEGVSRPSGERRGDIRIISRRDMSWIWLIPLSDTLTSVGVVLPRERRGPSGESADATLERLLAATPAASRQTRDARRVTEARIEADFSYRSRAYAGRRWLLVGDAGSFLDPVFSSGVLLALESGVEAAGAIDRALASGDVSAASFAAFERTQRRRYTSFRRMVRGFYDPPFRDLFFHPTNRFGLLDAIVTLLAGHWRLPFGSRCRLEIFFALVRLQRFLPIAPRYHDRAADG